MALLAIVLFLLGVVFIMYAGFSNTLSNVPIVLSIVLMLSGVGLMIFIEVNKHNHSLEDCTRQGGTFVNGGRGGDDLCINSTGEVIGVY